MIRLFTSTPHRMVELRKIATRHPKCLAVQMSTSSATNIPMDEIMNEKTSAQPYNAIPGPRGIYDIPYIGFLFHLKPFTNHTSRKVNLLLNEMIERYGSIFRIRLNVPTVVITDPKDYATLVRQEGKYPFRPNLEIFEMYHKRTGMPRGLVALQGPEWWRLRQPIQKTMVRPKQISSYLPFMNEVADDFIRMLSSGYLKNHDINTTFNNFMAESVGTAFFNRRLGFLNSDQTETMKNLQQATNELFDIIHKTLSGNSTSFKIYRSKDYRRFETCYEYVKNQISEYIAEEKANMLSKQATRTHDESDQSILRSLLEQTNEVDANLIMETMYPAAIDSSGASLQLILHILASHPDKQEKLRKEIRDVLGDPSNENDSKIVVTQEHLDKMSYLKAFVKEAFRYRTASIFPTTRIFSEDVVLGGYTVPAGVQVIYILSKASHDENIFENPGDFKPERWLRNKKTEASVETVNDGQSSKGNNDISWAIHPFGIGSRSCPGRRLFEQEVYLFLAKLVHEFKVGLEPDSMDVDFEFQVFVRFVEPPKFTFTPISTSTHLH